MNDMNMMQIAWEEVVAEQDRQTPTSWYVTLIEQQRRYGGPEEGGWYYTASDIIEYAVYPTEELAEAVAVKIRKIAKEMCVESIRKQSLALQLECDKLESLGLDLDDNTFFNEPDGPTEYVVDVRTRLPEVCNGGKPRYE